jgi:hypothetical protein
MSHAWMRVAESNLTFIGCTLRGPTQEGGGTSGCVGSPWPGFSFCNFVKYKWSGDHPQEE